MKKRKRWKGGVGRTGENPPAPQPPPPNLYILFIQSTALINLRAEMQLVVLQNKCPYLSVFPDENFRIDDDRKQIMDSFLEFGQFVCIPKNKRRDRKKKRLNS